MDDNELRRRLRACGFNPPPVTDSTRQILLKKLNKLEQGSGINTSASINSQPSVITSQNEARTKPTLQPAKPFKPPSTPEAPPPIFSSPSPITPASATVEQSFSSSRSRSTRSTRKEAGVDAVDFEKRNVTNSTPIDITARHVTDNGSNHGDPYEHGSDSDDARPTNAPSRALPRKPLGTRRETEYYSSPVKKFDSSSSFTSHRQHIRRSPTMATRPSSPPSVYVHLRNAFNSLTPTTSVFILISVLFVIIGVVYYSNNDQVAGELIMSNPVKPLCSVQGREGVSCIMDSEMTDTLEATKLLYRTLHKKAVKQACEESSDSSTTNVATMTGSEVTELFTDKFECFRYQADKHLANVIVMAKANPDFKILWQKEKTIFSLENIELSLKCEVGRYVRQLSHSLFMIVIFVLLVASMISLFNLYKARHNEHDKGVQELVKGIVDILQSHATNHPEQNFLPIVHVRDQLVSYPDGERDRKLKLWNEAVKYVEDNDSRIVKELQPLQGEDYKVWRWLAGGAAATAAADGDTPQVLPKPRTWHGEAFDANTSNNVNVPSISPTPCLKVRNMFSAKKASGEVGDWVTAVKDAILERCENVDIIHISVDESSTDGCVYVKCATPQEAGKAFRRMHGAWFDGQIVGVKHLRLERYHERFPNSINLQEPLVPSNDLRRSIV